MATIATCTLGPSDAPSFRQQFGYAFEERWKVIAVAPVGTLTWPRQERSP
jgi:hypothetical protein